MDSKNDLVERMMGTYEASRFQMNDSPRIDDRMRDLTEVARLFYRYHIPSWPLGMLFRKIIRRLVMPIMMPQVDFNLAARDVLLELRQRSDAQTAANREMGAVVQDLEHQIELLQEQVRTLTSNRPPVTATNGAEIGLVGARRS